MKNTVVPCREHFVLFYLISFYIFHICWKYFKDGWVHFPSRINRKSGSPIIRIATANVEAAENCCYVNAKIADFGWVAWRGFVKRREQFGVNLR